MREKGNNFRETMSALIDGEVSEFEIRRLLSSLDGHEHEELREAWNRYNIASSVIRGETFLKQVDFQLQVADEVNMEFDDQSDYSWTLSGFARQFSVAASVALITVLGVQQLNLSWFHLELENTGVRHDLVENEIRSQMQYPKGFEPRIDAQTVSTDPVVADPDRWELNLNKHPIPDTSSEVGQQEIDDQVGITSHKVNHNNSQKLSNDMRQQESSSAKH